MAGRQQKAQARRKVDTVLVRIKRYGDNGWATCGIGVRPPEKLIGDPRMKKLCPKLVPGQVIELPYDHKILKNKRLIEVVDEPEEDEFIRPWVFRSDADAAMSNPSKSRLGPEQILTGLALSSGAAESQLRKMEVRKQAQEEAGYNSREPFGDGDFYADYDATEDPEPDFADDGDGEEEDFSEEAIAKRATNRVTRDVKEDAEPVADDEQEEAPAPRTGRASRKAEGTTRAGRTSRSRNRG